MEQHVILATRQRFRGLMGDKMSEKSSIEQWLFNLFRAIYFNDIFRLILLVFLMSASFLTGFIWRIGYSYLPLIDTASVFGLISIYAGSFAVLFTLFKNYLRLMLPPIKFGRWKWLNSNILSPTSDFVDYAMMAIFALHSLMFIALNPVSSIFYANDDYYGALLIDGLLIAALFNMFMSSLYLHFKQRRELPGARPDPAIIIFCFLLIFVYVGSAYVTILRYVDPKLVIVLKEKPQIKATIITSGDQGLLLFTKDEKVPVFYTWSQIAKIERVETSSK